MQVPVLYMYRRGGSRSLSAVTSRSLIHLMGQMDLVCLSSPIEGRGLWTTDGWSVSVVPLDKPSWRDPNNTASYEILEPFKIRTPLIKALFHFSTLALTTWPTTHNEKTNRMLWRVGTGCISSESAWTNILRCIGLAKMGQWCKMHPNTPIFWYTTSLLCGIRDS